MADTYTPAGMAAAILAIPGGGSGYVPLDAGSTVPFSFGCDAGGFYVVTDDEA